MTLSRISGATSRSPNETKTRLPRCWRRPPSSPASPVQLVPLRVRPNPKPAAPSRPTSATRHAATPGASSARGASGQTPRPAFQRSTSAPLPVPPSTSARCERHQLPPANSAGPRLGVVQKRPSTARAQPRQDPRPTAARRPGIASVADGGVRRSGWKASASWAVSAPEAGPIAIATARGGAAGWSCGAGVGASSTSPASNNATIRASRSVSTSHEAPSRSMWRLPAGVPSGAISRRSADHEPALHRTNGGRRRPRRSVGCVLPRADPGPSSASTRAANPVASTHDSAPAPRVHCNQLGAGAAAGAGAGLGQQRDQHTTGRDDMRGQQHRHRDRTTARAE